MISTDAHSVAALGNLRWGVQMARRAWVSPDDVLNTRTSMTCARCSGAPGILTWRSPASGSSP